jgi:hypothetical protein
MRKIPLSYLIATFAFANLVAPAGAVTLLLAVGGGGGASSGTNGGEGVTSPSGQAGFNSGDAGSGGAGGYWFCTYGPCGGGGGGAGWVGSGGNGSGSAGVSIAGTGGSTYPSFAGGAAGLGGIEGGFGGDGGFGGGGGGSGDYAAGGGGYSGGGGGGNLARDDGVIAGGGGGGSYASPAVSVTVSQSGENGDSFPPSLTPSNGEVTIFTETHIGHFFQIISKTFSYTGEIVDYTIPVTSSYDIDAYGAQGGWAYYGGLGGYGAELGGDVTLRAGTVLGIVVGGAGECGCISGPDYGAGGGGGSFVWMISEPHSIRRPAVPEPSTWAMIALGFGGLGLVSVARQRRAGGARAVWAPASPPWRARPQHQSGEQANDRLHDQGREIGERRTKQACGDHQSRRVAAEGE